MPDRFPTGQYVDPLCHGRQRQCPAAAKEEAVILTPPPPATPRINGAKIFGVRPGHPFLFTIPATGQRPMEFTVDDLPAGLKVDPQPAKSPAR